MKTKDHALISLRINGCYFWFNVLQFIITFCFILIVVLNFQKLAGFIQIWVFFFMALDLMLRYFSEGDQIFFDSKTNRIDLFILLWIILCISGQFLAYNRIHSQQDILAGLGLILRIVIQSYRLYSLFYQSKATASQANFNISFQKSSIQDDHRQHEDIIIRERNNSF